MKEQMPQTTETTPKTVELDAEQALENELGQTPESLEMPVKWAGHEQEELAQAAVQAAPEEDPTFWQKAGRKVGSRIIMTGLAVATLMPMLAPTAEAGERGRNWRRAGAIVSILGGVGERVMAAKQYEHERRAERMGYHLRMLQNEGENLLHRMQMLNERQADLEEKLNFEKRDERRERLEYELHRVELAKDGLRDRAAQIDGQIARLGPAFQKEAEAAGKAGLFRQIADIAGSEGQRMRWGGY